MRLSGAQGALYVAGASAGAVCGADVVGRGPPALRRTLGDHHPAAAVGAHQERGLCHRHGVATAVPDALVQALVVDPPPPALLKGIELHHAERDIIEYWYDDSEEPTRDSVRVVLAALRAPELPRPGVGALTERPEMSASMDSVIRAKLASGQLPREDWERTRVVPGGIVVGLCAGCDMPTTPHDPVMVGEHAGRRFDPHGDVYRLTCQRSIAHGRDQPRPYLDQRPIPAPHPRRYI